MGTFLKANFRLIKRMEREHIAIRLARHTQANGLMIFSMERGLKFYQMALLIKVTLEMAKNQVRERTVGLTAHFTRENGTTINLRVTVGMSGRTGGYSRVSGKIINFMVKGTTRGRMVAAMMASI